MHSAPDGRWVTVHLPGALRSRAGATLRCRAEGTTVREVVKALDRLDPGLGFRLCLETGDLRPYVNVFVNGANVRYAQGLDTAVPEEAAVHIFQSVAGG